MQDTKNLEEHPTTIAYIIGFEDYWNGKSFLDNPYQSGTIEYNEWRDGWSDNRKVDEEQEDATRIQTNTTNKQQDL